MSADPSHDDLSHDMEQDPGTNSYAAPGPDPAPTLLRYLLYAVGAVMIFVGARGIYLNVHNFENPVYWLKLFIGGAIAHDLLVAPIVAAVGVGLTKLVPSSYRTPVQGGLFATAILAAISYPGVRRFGVVPSNPSFDPRNYAHGLLLALAVVWFVVLVVEARRLVQVRSQRAGPAATPPTGA